MGKHVMHNKMYMLFRDHSEVRTGNNTHFIEPTRWDLLKNNNRGGSFNLLMILEF